MSAVVPANAQSVHQKNANSGKTCWIQTDSSRLTGYYDVCTDTKQIDAPRRQLTLESPPPSVTVADSPRDSGGDAGGGGGGDGSR